jgi:hypothetical protein
VVLICISLKINNDDFVNVACIFFALIFSMMRQTDKKHEDTLCCCDNILYFGKGLYIQVYAFFKAQLTHAEDFYIYLNVNTFYCLVVG